MIWENNKRYLINKPKQPRFNIEEYNKYVNYKNKASKIGKCLQSISHFLLDDTHAINITMNPWMYIHWSIWTWE